MLQSYSDIRALIPQEPQWYDVNGVPRYAPFHPELLGVYARLALYVEIRCQSCHHHFYVGDEWGMMDNIGETLADVAEGYHYGDPPNHGCVGDTMNCEDLVILQAWAQEFGDGGFPTWQRDPTCEGPLDGAPVTIDDDDDDD